MMFDFLFDYCHSSGFNVTLMGSRPVALSSSVRVSCIFIDFHLGVCEMCVECAPKQLHFFPIIIIIIKPFFGHLSSVSYRAWVRYRLTLFAAEYKTL